MFSAELYKTLGQPGLEEDQPIFLCLTSDMCYPFVQIHVILRCQQAGEGDITCDDVTNLYK